MPLFSSQQRTRILEGRAPQPERVPDPGATATSLLKRYRPLGTRAEGGFGSVEMCLDSRLQRRVAIKRIPLASPDIPTTVDTVAEALSEARTASLLAHPNIVPVYDFTYDAAYAYLVMEYVDGMNLAEFLQQVDGHSLTFDETANVADALVAALSYAHENGVLHLDIKPANVLIDHSGNVKLTDFGMATLTSAAGFGGARGGTIGYMSPEQLRGGVVDERSDVFSLACVLYEALCGSAPFLADTAAESDELITEGVVRPSELIPDIPETAERMLLAALSYEPERRPMSVAEFGEGFLAGLGHPRDGRRSLAAIIARLTSDESDAQQEADEPESTFELDPEKGYLGSRFPKAATFLTGAVAGIPSTVVSWTLLGISGLTDPVAQAASALAIGAAAAVAPQIGSALVFTGLIITVLGATPIVSALPVVALTVALACGWWLVWGRRDPGASAALALACALTATGTDPLVAAPLSAALAGCLCPAVSPAASTALGLPLGALIRGCVSSAGFMDAGMAFAQLADPILWIATIGCAACAAAVCALLLRAWSRYRDGRGSGGYPLAYLVPACVSILLPCLASPMEIASLTPLRIATVAACGIVSSIIVSMYAYLFGYRKEPTGV